MKNKREDIRVKTEKFQEIFSQRLKTLRKEKLMSQKDVAEKLCIAVSTYANWEQGRRQPTVEDIFNLIRILDIEAAELFDVEI